MGDNRSERHSTYRLFVGIDIAAETASVSTLTPQHLPKRPFTVPQTPAGTTNLLMRLQFQQTPPEKTLIVMEATGTYWVKLATALYSAGYAISVISPARARNYALHRRIRSKTDAIDAKTLALLAEGEACPRLWQPPSDAMRSLQLLLRHHESVQATLVQEKNRLHALDQLPSGTDLVRNHIHSHVTYLQQQLSEIMKQAQELIQGDSILTQAFARLCTIKCVGSTTAMILLAETAAFAHCATAEQAVAFAGLDPKEWQSGRYKGQTRISKQGSPQLRRALYMAALSGAHFNPVLKPYYDRLIQAGKTKMTALIAVARKLLVIAWTLVRHNRDFDPEWRASQSLDHVGSTI